MKRIEICKVSDFNYSEIVEVKEEKFFQWLNEMHREYNEDMIIEWYYDEGMNENHIDLCVKIYDGYNE